MSHVIVRATPDGIVVEVRVVPRSRPRSEVVGERLVLGVAAAPVGGAATEEARRALAKVLGVARSRVTLDRGARSRTKRFAVAGVTPGEARRALGITEG
jgi:uncharacterized protein YggU (UPF0235/DUF167 family)